MDLLTIVLLILVPVNLLLTVWLFVSWRRQNRGDTLSTLEKDLTTLKSELVSGQMEGLVSLRESLDSATKLLNERLAEGNTSLDRRMEVIGEIENRLGHLSHQTKRIESIGENIQSLADLLKPPKLRGNLGELWLENILAQILPRTAYETQYKFPDGLRVDAVIRLADRLLPVDSKFPMESYRRLTDETAGPDNRKAALKSFSVAIRKHIDDISDKYLRPGDGTTDFAVMYLPSEAVYYQLVAADDNGDYEYALNRKIIPTSPGILYGFLASVATIYAAAGLTAERGRLIDDLNALMESLTVVQKHDDRLGGSLRQAGMTLDKVKAEHLKMADLLERLLQPEPATDHDER